MPYKWRCKLGKSSINGECSIATFDLPEGYPNFASLITLPIPCIARGHNNQPTQKKGLTSVYSLYQFNMVINNPYGNNPTINHLQLKRSMVRKNHPALIGIPRVTRGETGLPPLIRMLLHRPVPHSRCSRGPACCPLCTRDLQRSRPNRGKDRHGTMEF